MWAPDLNDGIVIVLAPLWRLFAHHRAWSSELKKHWAKLAKGDYDWAQLAMRLWPERVVPKCAEDRSLAIAHGLEDVFWVADQANEDKWLPRQTPATPIDQLIAQRHNPAITAALERMSNVTHLLHVYIAEQLAQHLNNHRVVVWYDPRSEFEPFVSELGGKPLGDGLLQVIIGGVTTTFAIHDGSLYSLRSRVEPLAGVDEPQAVVLYLPGVSRDPDGSVLMELELAGWRWEPQLRQLARYALRQRYTDGVIDELLDRERVTYEDLVAASAAEGAAPPSVLKTASARVNKRGAACLVARRRRS